MAEDVHTHIEALVAEEHKLWEHEAAGNASEHDRRRLAEVKVELDRYWDLLPGGARKPLRAATPKGQLRSESTVEGYLQ